MITKDMSGLTGIQAEPAVDTSTENAEDTTTALHRDDRRFLATKARPTPQTSAQGWKMLEIEFQERNGKGRLVCSWDPAPRATSGKPCLRWKTNENRVSASQLVSVCVSCV